MAESFRRGRTGQVREALDRLERLVVDGLKRGFFDYSIAVVAEWSRAVRLAAANDNAAPAKSNEGEVRHHR